MDGEFTLSLYVEYVISTYVRTDGWTEALAAVDYPSMTSSRRAPLRLQEPLIHVKTLLFHCTMNIFRGRCIGMLPD